MAEDRQALIKMVEISGAKSVPVIAACGEVMIGFEPKRLEQMIGCIKERSDGK